MTFDCNAFQESTSNTGLQPVAPAGGERHGYIIDGDGVQMKKAGEILAMLFQTAAIANFVEGRMGPQTISKLRRSNTQSFVRQQDGAIVNPMQNMIPYIENDILNCDVDNGGVAQVESLVYLVTDGPKPLLYFGERPNDLPPNSRWIVATGVTAALANQWTPDVATYTFEFQQKKIYDVYGYRSFSPTGYASRINPQGDDQKYRPGWGMGDSNILLQTIYSKSPMYSFSGKTPPQFDKLCSGVDSTTSRYEILCVEK